MKTGYTFGIVMSLFKSGCQLSWLKTKIQLKNLDTKLRDFIRFNYEKKII